MVAQLPPKRGVLVHKNSLASCFEQIELQAKLLNYFLGSSKSNINQSIDKASIFETVSARILSLALEFVTPRRRSLS